MPQVFTNIFETGWGVICTAATSEGLTHITLPSDNSDFFDSLLNKHYAGWRRVEGSEDNRTAETQLREYLDGKRKEFDLRLHLTGTDFQKQVLSEVARIPYGQTATYGEIARRIDKPGASQAVGAANGSNPLPIVIPCHRIVAGDGIGGYAGGLELKRKLLKLEGASLDRTDNLSLF